jgi:type VI secretion system protein ImpK
MCLLLGFQGRYMLEGTEKLNYLTSRLGDEIAHLKGKRGGFAPHGRTSEARMNAYSDVVKMAPRAANLTITLP